MDTLAVLDPPINLRKAYVSYILQICADGHKTEGKPFTDPGWEGERVEILRYLFAAPDQIYTREGSMIT